MFNKFIHFMKNEIDKEFDDEEYRKKHSDEYLKQLKRTVNNDIWVVFFGLLILATIGIIIAIIVYFLFLK